MTGLALLVLAVQLGLAFAWVEPAPLSIDEVIYHRMTHGLVEGNGLTLWNGFRETPSPELTALYIRPSEGRLVGQYPYGFPTVAAPFYALFGYRGLFVVNALAFVGVLALTHHFAMRLLGSSRAALASAALLAAGTYAWEYSMAAWPHALALLFAMAALATGLAAHRATPGTRRALGLAASSGLLLGVGTTVRFDVFFLLPLVALLFFLARPLRARELGSVAAGLVPGLAFASATNWIRWGLWNPFSYGSAGGLTDVEPYMPLLGAGLLGAVLLRAATGPRGRGLLAAHARAVAIGALGLLLAALVLPASREILLETAHGAHTILVDLRSLPLRSEPAMARTEEGAVVYYGGVKKALLQSCPYLVLMLLPLGSVLRRECAATPRLLLFGPVLAIAGVFSFFSWHGGLALNMRYLLPALPFASILVVDALRMLGRSAPRRALVPIATAITGGGLAFLTLRPPPNAIDDIAPLLLDVPLVLAALLLVGCAAHLLRGGQLATSVTLAVAGAAIGWSSAVAFGYDAAWAHHRRAAHHDFAARVGRQIEGNSLLFVDSATPFYGIVEHRSGIRVAIPWADRFQDAEALIDHNRARGRPVYGALTPRAWRSLSQSGALRGLRRQPIDRVGPFHLGRILPEGVRKDSRIPQ